MTEPHDLRDHGPDVLGWAARYRERIESLPVLSHVEPGWVRAQLPEHAPEQPEPWEAILADLDRIVVPGITHWQSPNFFGFFPANASEPAVLGDLLSSALGVQGMLWATSPACTELETHVLDWMVDLLGLPDRFRSTGAGGGVIQDSASSATLCAIVAARERAREAAGGDVRCMRAYTSTQGHSSIEKGLRVAGLTADQLRMIDTDARGAMRADLLADAVAADRATGLVPFFICATVGTTSSAAVDPVDAIGAIAGANGVWLHVDAAYAGAAAVCEELRPRVNAGVEHADSWCFDPHKWLLTNFDCDVFYVADRRALVGALSVLPEYLRNAATESGAVVDYRDWHVPLGRRFRALKLWCVLRRFGAQGLREHIRHHTALAAGFAERIDADPRFEVVAPVHFGLVCFRHVDGDEAGERIVATVNDSGRAYLTSTRLDGRFVIRVAIGQTATEARHVDALWDLLDGSAGQ
jgi:aromatic-L-amino-acid/L-tryptophan decarboxylase